MLQDKYLTALEEALREQHEIISGLQSLIYDSVCSGNTARIAEYRKDLDAATEELNQMEAEIKAYAIQAEFEFALFARR